MSTEIKSKPGLPTPEGSHVYRNKEQIRITDPRGVACLKKYRANQDYRPRRGRMSIEIQSKPGLPTPEGSHVYRNKEQIRITDPRGVACLKKYRANQDYRPRRGRMSIEIQSKPGLPTPEGSHVYRNKE
ncbi:hypothetical protein SDC9_41209 [bioreactor metagenome]|uniref:Uncharacterized protein n=1 Tax=bioreactor metagenome TaxID=1076179 RepID=A0A644VUM4_9ZZZZ